MSGLLAFLSARPERPALADALELLNHRGPDETRLTAGDDPSGMAGTVLFGHKRLATIDVAGSHQPFSYADGRYLVISTGAIYNHVELREELIREAGAEFTTTGDVEVLAAGYHHWGERLLPKLRGMFAFVLWDSQRGRAFAARDAFGMEPLHYLETDEGLYLASEKKALLPFASVDAPVDAAGLAHYLSMQFVPEPGTLHPSIKRVAAGHALAWSPGEAPEPQRWHRPDFRPAPSENLSERILSTLRESVRIHLRSDVPVGAFLSGGIDSTAVVALAREFNPNILTFTAGYDVPGYSEIELAGESARSLQVTAIPTRITPADVIEALPRIIWYLDDPLADPALVPLYFLAKRAAEHVTVVLSGEGADELFAGYPIYREPLSLASIQALPDPVRAGLRLASRVIPTGVKGRSFLQRGTTRIEARHFGNARIFDEREKRLLLRGAGPWPQPADLTAPIYAEAGDIDDVTRMQYLDLHTWLPCDILVKADRMAMAHSLQTRMPFLDPAVFEVAASVPTGLNLPPRSEVTKSALREALRPVVPGPVADRPKLGFPTPIRVWLKDELYEWARDIFGMSSAAEVLDLSYAVRLLDEHRLDQRDNSRKVWTVLVFCLWWGIFVDQTLRPQIPRQQSALLTKPVVGSVVG